MDFYGWRPYVSVAERRRKALKEMEKLKKKGHPVSPVVVDGRMIAKTFWGKAWCENLERYSDYENRLPRGRTYVRNGSVCDLQIAAGEIKALVSGSELYKVAVKVVPVAKARWQSICVDCAGAIESLVELLQGKLSKGVMERVCRPKTGLFPSPSEIKLSCSCPDGAYMCKHVAAVLYGIGARLDQQPELLFLLHGVEAIDLITSAGKGTPMAQKAPASAKVLGGEDLSALFGLEMAPEGSPARPKRPKAEMVKTAAAAARVGSAGSKRKTKK
ncbi:MAG: SWIM zinc finger family protein [Acidobacteria bacterium]|nr:SWIM zinc finger family protein [Acidobacteriota bacterium]